MLRGNICFQSANHVVRSGRRLGLKPDVRRVFELQPEESGRSDANYRIGVAINFQDPPDYARTAAETSLPKTVADHCTGRIAVRNSNKHRQTEGAKETF